MLGPDSSQADVYNAAVRDVVDDVMKGFNGTVLTYGQTGAPCFQGWTWGLALIPGVQLFNWGRAGVGHTLAPVCRPLRRPPWQALEKPTR